MLLDALRLKSFPLTESRLSTCCTSNAPQHDASYHSTIHRVEQLALRQRETSLSEIGVTITLCYVLVKMAHLTLADVTMLTVPDLRPVTTHAAPSGNGVRDSFSDFSCVNDHEKHVLAIITIL